MSSSMDCRIWRNLPQKLLERILAFLSPPAFFRARSVCRRWYSLLFSQSFLELQLRVRRRRHWFIFFQHDLPSATVSSADLRRRPQSALIFDLDDHIWRKIPLSDLIPPGFYPAASSGGILCFVPEISPSKSLILCNPISRISVNLPAALRPRLFPAVGLAAGDTSLAVLLAGDDLISPYAVKNLTSELFLTGAASYTPAAPLPRLCNLQSGRMIFHGGKFFCMSFNPYSILVCDLAGASWEKIQPPMKRFLRSPSILEIGGAVVMVAAVEKSKLAVPRSLRIWELQSGGGWAEMERMPGDIFQEFAREEKGKGFEVVGSGEWLAVTIKGSGAVMGFNVRERRWRWMPTCPFLEGREGLRGYVFEPRIATPALAQLQALHFAV